MRLVFMLILGLLVQSVSFGQLPDEFTDQVILDDWFHGIGLTFDEEGRGYLFHKSGYIQYMNQDDEVDPNPIIDIREEVGYWGDHGLLSVVLDPGFVFNGHIYLYYQVDLHHLRHFGTAQYHPDSTITHQATIGRITRYTLSTDDYKTLVPDSRKVLVGETASTGIPLLHNPHGTCSLAFGIEATLMISGFSSSPTAMLIPLNRTTS